MIFGVIGLLTTALMFIWLVVGWMDFLPSMIEIFGIEGLRIPAAIAIGGLLMAAVGFDEF